MKYQGGVLERDGDRRETSSTMAEQQCINHSGGLVSVFRQRTVGVNISGNRNARGREENAFLSNQICKCRGLCFLISINE